MGKTFECKKDKRRDGGRETVEIKRILTTNNKKLYITKKENEQDNRFN